MYGHINVKNRISVLKTKCLLKNAKITRWQDGHWKF
jgi:hypothetical protein